MSLLRPGVIKQHKPKQNLGEVLSYPRRSRRRRRCRCRCRCRRRQFQVKVFVY